ncbi:MAG: adenylyl-sulfate kinase [Blastocatellia bacterium]|jgi:bifunctional enzyme CysN/CysC
MDSNPILRLMACGSVDDGKSTLIGRLLVETDSVPQDTVAAARTARRAGSTVSPGEIDFSLLTDGLEAEREQGITIDVAYRAMSLPDGRRMIIADAPGHEQYTRNMVVAASRADIALVLVDAVRGVRQQTLRHLTICSLLGVEKVIFAINKLDLLGFEQKAFDELVAELESAVDRLDLPVTSFVPVSALAGDNVTARSARTDWYRGSTVLEEVGRWRKKSRPAGRSRLGVQLVSRADNFRGVAGTICEGRFAVGEEVVILPGERRARLVRLVTFDGDLESANEGSAVTMVLEPEVDVSRGDYIERALGYTPPADHFTAHLVWLEEEPLSAGRTCHLINGSARVPATVTSIHYRLNIDRGGHETAGTLASNEIGMVDLETEALIPLARYAENRYAGNFILVDRVTFKTIAAGMVSRVSRRAINVTRQGYAVDKEARAAQKGHRAKVIWLTGLPGSGKSTIADGLERRLFAAGIHSYTLDGDNLRFGLNSDLGFTREDRKENVRRVAEVARLMVDAGMVVTVALVSPFKADRDLARQLFQPHEFIEVWVRTPLEVCVARDPKGLYQKARDGSLPNLTGIGQEYEPPVNPEMILDGTAEIAHNLEMLVRLIG